MSIPCTTTLSVWKLGQYETQLPVQLDTAAGPRRWPGSRAERLIYSVDGCVLAYSLQADSDVHVVLRGKRAATMIVEFPDPRDCGTSVVFARPGFARAIAQGPRAH